MSELLRDESAAGCLEAILANWSAFMPDLAEAVDTVFCNGIVEMCLDSILKNIFG